MKTIKLSGTTNLSLSVEKSEDAWTFDINKVSMVLSPEYKARLLHAMEECKKNDWWNIEMWFDNYVSFTKDKIEDQEYRSGADCFKVRENYITFYSENKYNGQCYMESEEFTINPS